MSRTTNYDLRAKQVADRRRERARVMRKLRNTVKPGERFELPHDSSYWFTWCAVRSLGWSIEDARGIDKHATRPR